MNTKTMRLPPRRALTSNKRKDREDFDAVKPTTTTTIANPPKLDAFEACTEKAAESVASNKLLAGYLAHEFLTKGTLFGEPWEPTRSQAVLVSAEESRKGKPIERAESKPSEEAESQEGKRQRYVELAYLLRADGNHLEGFVNPTQLARFLQM